MKFIRFVFWLVAVLILVVVGDRLVMHYSFDAPGLKPAQQFYRDFRDRLLTLHRPDDMPDRIGQTIEEQAVTPERDVDRRYVYVDDKGELHFADSLKEVPAIYRGDAQVLED